MDVAEFEKHEQLEATHWWFEGRRRCIAAVLDAWVGADRTRRILDVGCGTGGMFPLLERYGAVSGAEFSPDARERAQRRFPGVELFPCALPAGLPPGPYDVITAFDVIEHLDAPEESLRQMRARLSPGGKLVVTVPAFQFLWSKHDEVLQHRRRYSRELLVRHLEAGGLRVLFDSFFNTGLFPAVAAARLLERVRPPSSGDSDLSPAPAPVNALLTALFGAEGRWLRRRRFPVGVSLIAVAEAR